MRLLGLVLAGVISLAAGAAMALDPGTASGRYARDGVALDFHHAVALRQDNAEGLLEDGEQIRLVLSDVEVPVIALYGVVFPPVNALGRSGAVRGVVLEFSPEDPKAMHGTVLAPPEDPGSSLTNISLANSQGVFKRIEVTPTRVSGEYEGGEDGDFRFSFSAPVFTDPVQADLRGPAAQASEQVRILLARAQALARGDVPAALALSARGSGLRKASPADIKAASGMIGEMIRDVRSIKRVVVRRETAVALMPEGSWASFVIEEGAWKVAD